ncbi:hypothetical protein EI94DRAFT_1746328 [Lactarius quietus]|nr:hypothetical protein EI94DRAFT_1746328 [Lactarius quietus]
MSALDVNGTFCAHSTILTNGQTIGLALTVEASFLSLGAILVIFILIVKNVLHYRKTFLNGDWKLLRTPADIYMPYGIITTGPYCTTQGIIKQIGAVGVALITLILTIHTFTMALWRVGVEACSFAFSIIALTCLFIVLWVGISNGIHKDFESPAPYWCWIGSKYNGECLAGEYLWMWTALFATVVMYKWYKFRLVKSDVEYSQRCATLGLLLYPLAYSLVVIPLSVSRWLLFIHKNEPSAATFFGMIMFNLSGAINILIFLIELGEAKAETENPSTTSAICSAATSAANRVTESHLVKVLRLVERFVECIAQVCIE